MTHSPSRTRFAIIGGCVLVAAVLITLGFWQLQRAEEKKEMIHVSKLRRQKAPLKFEGRAPEPERLRYRRVLVAGRYDLQHQFLLDNRVVDGRVGVYVFTPLKIDGSGEAVLINRGWLPMSNRSVEINDLDIPQARVTIEGIVDNFPDVAFRLDGAEIPSGGWPGLIQVVDVETLSRVLGYPLLPFQVLLQPDAESGFVRQWMQESALRPERHLAYAFQWFALALGFVVMLLWKRTRPHD